MASRKTFDGQAVTFWTDGAVTVGHALNNRFVARALSARAMWIIADEVCLYDAGEVTALVKGVRRSLDEQRAYPHRHTDRDVARCARVWASRYAARLADGRKLVLP